jgi:CheY-like chemotaxis protein
MSDPDEQEKARALRRGGERRASSENDRSGWKCFDGQATPHLGKSSINGALITAYWPHTALTIRKLLKSKEKLEPWGVSWFILPMYQSGDPRTILVVDDEPFIRMSSVATLEDAGFWVLQAKDSAEALKILSRHPEISILMTDVRMPGSMDGLALIAQVCIDYPVIRAIVVSANASAEQASDAGALGFVAKPYLAQTMVQAVHDTVLRN